MELLQKAPTFKETQNEMAPFLPLAVVTSGADGWGRCCHSPTTKNTSFRTQPPLTEAGRDGRTLGSKISHLFLWQ